MPAIIDDFLIDTTGDVVAGDEISWTEGVFGGSYRRPAFLGERTIHARVTKDSYGADKQQHTFTLEVIAASGVDAPAVGALLRRKGRNVYRNGTLRRPWSDEIKRCQVAQEKHTRGDHARAAREQRKDGSL